MTKTIELTESTPEHICFSDSDTYLCDADCNGEDSRFVSADQDPIADASVHLCPDCADEWARIAGDVEREPTVQCSCDRLEEGHVWTCGEVVPVNVARALKHPDVDGGMVPVCPDCYEWIRERPTSGVETPVGDAPRWRAIDIKE